MTPRARLTAAAAVLVLLVCGCAKAYREFVDAYVRDLRVDMSGGVELTDLQRRGWLPKNLPRLDGLLDLRYSMDTNEVWACGEPDAGRDAVVQAFLDAGWQRVPAAEAVAWPRSPNSFRGEPDVAWWPDGNLAAQTADVLTTGGDEPGFVAFPASGGKFYLWSNSR